MSKISELNENISNIVSDVNNITGNAERLFDDVTSIFSESKRRMSPNQLMNDIQGYARSNRFRVLFPLPATLSNAYSPSILELISTQCQAVNLPSKQLGTFNHRNLGPIEKMPYDSIFNEITMTFRVDSKYLTRRFFQDWIMSINDHSGKTFKYRDEYQVDFNIMALNNKGDDVINIKVFQAYPTNLTAINLDENSTDTITEFSVSFVYTQWREQPIDGGLGLESQIKGMFDDISDTASDYLDQAKSIFDF